MLLTFLVGCGKGHVSLKGTVTFSDDGSPLPTGTVAFVKGGIISRGDLTKDGTYVVGTEKAADGLPPGTYQVFISSARNATLIDKEYGIYEYEQLIDKKYESADTSGLSVTVDASTKTFDIQVNRFAGK